MSAARTWLVPLTLCLAVVAGCGGSGGDDFAWKRVDSGTDKSLNAVAAHSADLAFAVGEGGTILRWDGTRWSPMGSGVTSSLTRIRAQAGGTWVFPETGAPLRLDGNSWVAVPTPQNERLYDVLPTGPNAALGVTDDLNGTSIWEWDGTAWSVLAGGANTNMGSIWGQGRDQYWVAESTERGQSVTGGRVFRRDAGGFTEITPENIGSNMKWVGMGGGADGSPWLYGTLTPGQITQIYRWKDGAWDNVLALRADVAAVYPVDAQTAFSSGQRGRVRRLNQGFWVDSLPEHHEAVTLRGIGGAGTGALWAVGDQGVILRFDPSFVPAD
jgi:trimeric autotransporter adhesin